MAAAREKVPCPRCAQLFAKSSLPRHLTRKVPCVPVAAQAAEARAAAVAEAVVAAAESPLKGAVWRARDILRRAGITGLEALDCIVTVIVLREAERLYGAGLDALADATDPARPNLRVPLGARSLLAARAHKFSAFAERVFDDGTGRNWADEVRSLLDVLRLVPAADALGPVIAERDKLFALRDSRAAFELVRHVRDAITFDAAADTLGSAFQTVVRDLLDGKELGQFFTPPSVVRRAVEAARAGEPGGPPRELGDVLDPTCGSGAFLAAAAQAGGAPHGVEIDARVMLLACANVLLATGRPPRVARADFLRDALPAPAGEGPPPEGEAPAARAAREGARQFDTVLANPPFGVKGIDYDETARLCAAPGAFPLKSSATGLFLQRIVRSVRVGGRGVVVLPLGKELASASATEVRLRQALLRAVSLREVFAVGAGEFENTGIRTAVLVFDKVRELAECVAKKGKGVGVNADVPLATAAVIFHPAEGEPVTVDATALEAANWALSPDAYVAASSADGAGAAVGVVLVAPQGVEMVKLGDVCTIRPGKSLTRKNLLPGPYPVIGGGKEPLGFHNESNAEQNAVLISCTGSVGWVSRYSIPTFINSDCAEICPKEGVSGPYLYHLLRSRYDELAALRTGLAQPHLNKNALAQKSIPLPPLKRQKEIAAELDRLADEADSLRMRAAKIRGSMPRVLSTMLGAAAIPQGTAEPVFTDTAGHEKTTDLEEDEYGASGSGAAPLE